MEEGPENGKESSHSAYANGMNELMNEWHTKNELLNQVITSKWTKFMLVNKWK